MSDTPPPPSPDTPPPAVPRAVGLAASSDLAAPVVAARAKLTPGKRGRHSVRAFPAWAPWLFVAPFVLIFGLFVVWPLLSSMKLALEQTFGPGTSRFVGLGNFAFMMEDPLFWKAVRNTFVFTISATCLMIPTSLGLALLLNHPRVKGRAWFRLAFFSPSLVGTVFVGLIFALVFEKRTGLLNASLHAIFPAFDPEFDWLQDHVMPALIIAAIWLSAGFNMVYFLAALQGVSRDLTEAASIDGAGAWARFRHVVLPEIMPVLGFVTLLTIIGSFQLFELPWILLNNTAGPEQAGLTVVMYLYLTGFVTGDLGYASAVGWALAITLMIVALAQRWFMRRREEH